MSFGRHRDVPHAGDATLHYHFSDCPFVETQTDATRGQHSSTSDRRNAYASIVGAERLTNSELPCLADASLNGYICCCCCCYYCCWRRPAKPLSTPLKSMMTKRPHIHTHHLYRQCFQSSLQSDCIYTVNHKKRDTLFLTITLAKLNRFL